MLDLVTFLEQLKDPRNIRRMETTAIFPGMYEWTEMRGRRSSEEVILHQVVLEDHLQWKWFWKTWVYVHFCHRNVSPAPFSHEIIHEFISSDYFSPSQCELKVSSWLVTNSIHSLLFDYLGTLGKLCPFLSNCMTVLLKFSSTSRQKCVSGVVDKLPNF